MRFGAGLAYYTAFAVVPLVFIVVEVATLVVGQSAAEGVLMEQVEGLIGDQGAQAIHNLLDSWQNNGVGGLAALAEAATLLFALAGAFDHLQDALNWIWGVEPKRQGGVLRRFRHRFLSILGILGTAFLLLVSLVMTAGGQAVFSYLPGSGLLRNTIVGIISFVAVTLLFAMIFKLLPQAKVAWADVWIGAAVTGVLFSAGRWLIVLYLGETVIVSLYGSAAPLVIILLWAFYSSQILLFGAEFTAVYASECGSSLVAADDAVAVGEPAKSNEAQQQSHRRGIR
ncbi:MAG TPA: YihY/virulence factor BrkB family protein [Nitrospira sp.]|nr:YihY/virulence factor BrkB family protein [Nitrospira sp.]